MAGIISPLTVSPDGFTNNTDLDDIKYSMMTIVASVSYVNIINRPPIDGYFVFISCAKLNSTDFAQIAIGYRYGEASMYVREVGSSWAKIG